MAGRVAVIEPTFETVRDVAFGGIQDFSQRAILLNASHGPDTALEAAGINSVDLAEMICTSEQYWDIKLTDAEVDAVYYLSDLYRLVCSKK